MTHTDQDERKGFASDVGQGLVNEGRTWVRWGVVGAILGAVALGIVGAVYLGFVGFVIGAVIGAVVGGIGAVVFYMQASTLF